MMLTILILEDDPIWRDQHETWLRQAEFQTCSTDDAAIAIQHAKDNPAILVGIIDEILFVPPIIPGVKGELQNLQGEGVIRKIRETGSNMRFIFVTSAPSQYSLINQTDLFVETRSLRCIPGVIAVIHKEEMQGDDGKKVYLAMIELIRSLGASARQLAPSDSQFPTIPGGYIIMSNISIQGSNIGAIASDSTIHGGQITGAQIYQHQNLSEAAAEIQALLVQLADLYPSATDEMLAAEVVNQVKQKPQLREKIIRAIRDGGIEAVKQVFDHPAAKIAIAALEGFKDPS